MTPRLTPTPSSSRTCSASPSPPEQTACITAPPAPQVIVAAPAPARTTVMAARVVWLVGTGQVAPERVLGLTFTNKAAGELADRVRKALAKAGVTAGEATDEDGPGEPQISTYHAFAGRLLKEHGLRIGLEPTARLLADATRFQLAARVLRSSPGPHPALHTARSPTSSPTSSPSTASVAEHLVDPAALRAHDEELLSALEGARLTNADLRKAPETARARRELTGLVEAYRAEKRARDLLDFGDQIAPLRRDRPHPPRGRPHPARAVRGGPPRRVPGHLRLAQRLLLAGLFGAGTGHAVTAVGDPCQAIYGWRGASVANLDDFPRHFPHADGRPANRYALGENRRSGGPPPPPGQRPGRAAARAPRGRRGAAPRAQAPSTTAGALRPAATQAEELAGWPTSTASNLVRHGPRRAPATSPVLCRHATDLFCPHPAPRIRAGRDVAPCEVVPGLSGCLHCRRSTDLVVSSARYAPGPHESTPTARPACRHRPSAERRIVSPVT
ncbi:UvrD-helicase domain-containing protein [Streptomyces thioluteus]